MPDLKKIKTGAKVMGAMAAAAAAGYATGVLTAPASGIETRRRIRRRGEDAMLNARGAAQRTMKCVGDAAADAAKRVHTRTA